MLKDKYIPTKKHADTKEIKCRRRLTQQDVNILRKRQCEKMEQPVLNRYEVDEGKIIGFHGGGDELQWIIKIN